MSLKQLRNALLSNPPRPYGPDEGDAAFEAHIALATRITKAARLNARATDGEGDAWVRYLVDYFPAGHNDPDDARLLWTDWRTPLVKDRAPGPMVPVTHGQPEAHWARDAAGRLCINLESMQGDYERSVESFISALSTAPDRAAIALERHAKTTYAVEPFRPASVPASATAMSRWAGVSSTSGVPASVSAGQTRLAPVIPPSTEDMAVSAATAEAWSLGYVLFVDAQLDGSGMYVAEAVGRAAGGVAFQLASGVTRLEAATQGLAALRSRVARGAQDRP